MYVSILRRNMIFDCHLHDFPRKIVNNKQMFVNSARIEKKFYFLSGKICHSNIREEMDRIS